MNKYNFSKHIIMVLIPLFFILVLAFVFWLNEVHYRYYITAKFAESGPLYPKMSVYYKGKIVGCVKDINTSDDYKYTLVGMTIYPQNPKFSEDLIAKVKNHNVRKEYIELIRPDQASDTILKNGSVIDGEAAFDLEAFLSDIANAKIIVPLLQTFSDTLVSFEQTSAEIKNSFSDLRSLVKDNRQNINQTTKNLSHTTKSLTQLTNNVNKSVGGDKLDNTTTNIQQATENIKDITENIDKATKNLDKTVAKIDCTLSKTSTIADNVKVITVGLRETLGQKFAGLRIIFGKPIN